MTDAIKEGSTIKALIMAVVVPGLIGMASAYLSANAAIAVFAERIDTLEEKSKLTTLKIEKTEDANHELSKELVAIATKQDMIYQLLLKKNEQ